MKTFLELNRRLFARFDVNGPRWQVFATLAAVCALVLIITGLRRHWYDVASIGAFVLVCVECFGMWRLSRDR